MALSKREKLKKEIESLERIINDNSGNIPDNIKKQAETALPALREKFVNTPEVDIVEDKNEGVTIEEIQQTPEDTDLRSQVINVLKEILDKNDSIKDAIIQQQENNNTASIEKMIDNYLIRKGIYSQSHKYENITPEQQEVVNEYKLLYQNNCQSFSQLCDASQMGFTVNRSIVPMDNAIFIVWQQIEKVSSGVADTKLNFIHVSSSGKSTVLNHTMTYDQLQFLSNNLVPINII